MFRHFEIFPKSVIIDDYSGYNKKSRHERLYGSRASKFLIFLFAHLRDRRLLSNDRSVIGMDLPNTQTSI